VIARPSFPAKRFGIDLGYDILLRILFCVDLTLGISSFQYLFSGVAVFFCRTPLPHLLNHKKDQQNDRYPEKNITEVSVPVRHVIASPPKGRKKLEQRAIPFEGWVNRHFMTSCKNDGTASFPRKSRKKGTMR
jgi:hypothetical protein